MGIVEPLVAFVVSFLFLGVMVYKRVGLGITLTFTATAFSLLSLDSNMIADVFWETMSDSITISLLLATFGIMLLSQLYKETQFAEMLSQSLSEILKNSKLVVSVLPAIVGLLPVPGGALMSAPMVEAEADKLALKKDRQTYVNIWFRHTIFPIYPMSSFFLLAVALTGVSVVSLITRQMPVVVAMVILGFLIGFWRVASVKHEPSKDGLGTNFKVLLKAFAPILVMILAIVTFNIVRAGEAFNPLVIPIDATYDVSIAALFGLVGILLIAKPRLDTLLRPFRSRSIYEVTLAAFGAMLLRNVALASGISESFGRLIAGANASDVVLLLTLPAALAFLMGTPSGGLAISVPMLAGTLSFTPKVASLLYMATYLGYLGAPTHLCLIFTADYFKCSLGKLYRYLIPSLVVSFLVAVLVYFML
ncbi:MAG: DUF401 family protein [Candidatus Bathyarchaeota archaeon]|nr:MAG: DUF401 family protein [Candidatus Bathyarchaeota archaeon]